MNKAIIKLNSVSYTSPSGPKIVDDVSLEISEGDIFTIIGPNGGGKTTLLKLILRLLSPTEGKVSVAPSIRFGYMPQKLLHNNLLPIDTVTFLKLGKNFNSAKYSEVIKRQGISHLLGKQLGSLSGGELQKILFSKILLSDPDVFLLDEPSQGLDINGQVEFYKTLTQLNEKQKKTIIMVSHDLHTVMKSTSQVICLNHHICCHGLPDEIVKDQKYINIFGNRHKYLSHYIHEHDHRH